MKMLTNEEIAQLDLNTQNGLYLETSVGTFQSGQIFEAKTVKGGTNYVIFFFARGPWVYYCHGDRAKKVSREKFVSLIMYGDLNPIDRDKAEPERMALAVLGLQAMVNGVSFQDYLKVAFGHGQGSEAHQEA